MFGHETELFTAETISDARVGIDAAVTQERPVTTHVLDFAEVDLRDENFFLVVRALEDDAAEWVTEEAGAPELKSVPGLGFVAVHIAVFVSNTVDSGDIDSIRNRVRTLNSAPCIVLRFAMSRFLAGMPS